MERDVSKDDAVSDAAAERESLAFLLHEPQPEVMTMVILELAERLEQLARRVEALEQQLLGS